MIRWHRKGFRLYWRAISKRGPGRPPISEELQALFRQLAGENGWGARNIQAELGKLGFTANLATVSRYLPNRAPDRGKQQRWMTFLRNHKDVIAAMDFFVVTEAIEYLGVEPKRTAYRTPWQNGTAERWVGSARRELLDHVMVVNEQHLRRLLRDGLGGAGRAGCPGAFDRERRYHARHPRHGCEKAPRRSPRSLHLDSG